MGPGCFYPGNLLATVTVAVALALLQWGRDVSIPEIPRVTASNVPPNLLQWGRDVSIPEICVLWGMDTAVIGLQWGRDVSIPEMCVCGQGMGRSVGFNGAGMFLSRKYQLPCYVRGE